MNRSVVLLAALVFMVVACASYVRSPDSEGARRIVENVLKSSCARSSALDTKLVRLIFRNYRIQLMGRDCIGGQSLLVVALKSRFRNQPCRQLWIDEKSGNIVALKDWGRGSILKFVSVYDRLRIPMHESNVKPTDIHLQETLLRDLRPGSPVWRVGSLPLGFEYVGSRMIRGGWWQDVYSDGIFAVSVFSRFASGRTGKTGKEGSGIVCVPGVGLVMHVSRGAREFVIVGDISTSEMRRMASDRM